MGTKDFFSDHSKVYASFRPTYPEELYQFIFQHVRGRSAAWDCATGNGQAARSLANYFDKVFATDISQQQIDQAVRAENIFYSISRAEQTPFREKQFDLITVGQALHWIDVNEFYSEVNRVAKSNGLLAVWGYNVLAVQPEIDELLSDYYYNIVGPYWDSARRLVEEEYNNIPFPFQNIQAPKFAIRVNWSLEQFAGYLTSWSSTQKYIKSNKDNPVLHFLQRVQKFWDERENKTVVFPIFMKLGRIQN